MYWYIKLMDSEITWFHILKNVIVKNCFEQICGFWKINLQKSIFFEGMFWEIDYHVLFGQ